MRNHPAAPRTLPSSSAVAIAPRRIVRLALSLAELARHLSPSIVGPSITPSDPGLPPIERNVGAAGMRPSSVTSGQ
jgi:hypothetical protein